MQEMRDDQDALIHKVDALDANLRKFDEQAARMVTYFNDVSQSMEQRQDELSESLKVDIGARIDTFSRWSRRTTPPFAASRPRSVRPPRRRSTTPRTASTTGCSPLRAG